MPVAAQLQAAHWTAILLQGWHWWTAELRGLLPARVQGKAPRADIRLLRDRVEIERFAGGTGERLVEERPIEAFDNAQWAELAGLIADSRVWILLQPPDCLVVRTTLPKAARARLRAATALQLAQLAPLDPDRLCWAVRADEQPGPSLTVKVAMAHASRVEGVQASFEAHGLDAPAIFAPSDDGPIQIAPERSSSAGNGGTWKVALLLVASVPVTTIAGAQLLAGIHGARADSVETQLKPRLAAEARIRREERLRRALSSVFAHEPATDLLEHIALALPDDSHALSIEREVGGALAIVTDTPDPQTVATALEEDPILPGFDMEDMEPSEGSERMLVRFRSRDR